MEFDRTACKMDVKAVLRDCRPHRALVTLAFVMVVSAVSGAISGLFGTLGGGQQVLMVLMNRLQEISQDPYMTEFPEDFFRNAAGMFGRAAFFSMIGSIITTILTCIANTGYDGFTLAASRRDPQPAEKIFSVFPLWKPVIVTSFLKTLFSALWTALFAVAYVILLMAGVVLATINPILGIPLMLLGIVVIFVGILWVDYRFSMVNFILLDQGVSGLNALTASKQMMRGNYGKLFLLDLSFLPWYIPTIIGVFPALSFITVGAAGASESELMVIMFFIVIWLPLCIIVQNILSLWLRPYQGACHARFYDTLHGYIPLAPPAPPYQNGPQNYRYSWTDSAPTSGTGTANGDPWGNPNSWTKTSSSDDDSDNTWDQGRGSPTDFD